MLERLPTSATPPRNPPLYQDWEFSPGWLAPGRAARHPVPTPSQRAVRRLSAVRRELGMKTLRSRLRAALLVPSLLLASSLAAGVGPAPAAATAAPPTTATRAARLAACPAPVAFGSLPRFAHVAQADDITVSSDGHVWITTVTRNRIAELDLQGRPVASFADSRNPEGMVELPGGNFALAEQRAD